MKEFLESINACQDAMVWAGDKTWPEIFATCHRGDWLLWLFKKTNPSDLRALTLAKAHCANTVRHLMKDKRSTDAIDVAIKFGNGEVTRDELNAAADAAYAAYAAYAAADADAYAAYAADADAYAAADADAYAYAAADAADAARQTARAANQTATADVCRKYLPIEIWNIKQSQHA